MLAIEYMWFATIGSVVGRRSTSGLRTSSGRLCIDASGLNKGGAGVPGKFVVITVPGSGVDNATPACASQQL